MVGLGRDVGCGVVVVVVLPVLVGVVREFRKAENSQWVNLIARAVHTE